MADEARREGLLTLEDVVRDVDDDFLKRGVTLAVDRTDPEELREILEAGARQQARHGPPGREFYNDMGGYAPTIDIIGTVMGLVHVLENLSNPGRLDHLIAGAFVATLWGVMTANVMWLPIGSRLTRIGQLESARMELVIEGVLAVQAAEPARGGPAAGVADPAVGPALRGEGGLRWRANGSAATRRSTPTTAVADHLRGHDHAADGAVHRAVRGQPGRPEAVRDAARRHGRELRPPALAVPGDRSRARRGRRPAALEPVRPRLEDTVRKATQENATTRDLDREQQNWEQAEAEVKRLEALPEADREDPGAEGLPARRGHGRRPRPADRPGVAAHRLPGRPGRPERLGRRSARRAGPAAARPAGNQIDIAGHTNQVKVKPKFYPTDWELSAWHVQWLCCATCTSGRTCPARNMSAVAYGHERPLVDPGSRSRRR